MSKYYENNAKHYAAKTFSANMSKQYQRIDLYLKKNGIVYISGKNGIPTGFAKDGRYFLEFTEQLIKKILKVDKQIKLEQLWYTEDVSGRKGLRWMNVIFKQF